VDIQEDFVGGYGALVMKNKKGYIVLPLDEDNQLIRSMIQMIDVKWAKNLEETIQSYRHIIKICQHSIGIMEKLVETQKIRLLFEGSEEGK
jgi:hypothetical protein